MARPTLMGWYDHIYNYTKGENSAHEYKYGRAPLKDVLADQPTWSASDVIVGGGCDGASFHYELISQTSHRLVNMTDGDYISSFKIIDISDKQAIEAFWNEISQHPNKQPCITWRLPQPIGSRGPVLPRASGPVYNWSMREWSRRHDYPDSGIEDVPALLADNPTWKDSHAIVQGDEEAAFCLVTGMEHFYLIGITIDRLHSYTIIAKDNTSELIRFFKQVGPGSDLEVDLTFYDENGQPIVPASAGTK